MFHYDGEPSNCLAPRDVTPPRRISVPDGAWETHAHVIGLPPEFPLVADRHYTAPEATPQAFTGMLDRVGLSFGTLVQVSCHGTDNRLLLQALRAYPSRLRGVAVIAPECPDREMEELRAAGVTGIRLLDIVGGGVGLQNLEKLAARCAEVGWHIQLGVKGSAYPDLLPRLTRLRVPLMIDHMGWCPAAAGVQHPDFQAVLRLIRESHVSIKISGGFRMSTQPFPFRDTIPFAQAIIALAPERVVWGSDWPHVGLYEDGQRPDVGQLLDNLVDYTDGDLALQRQILVDNSARFYGCPP